MKKIDAEKLIVRLWNEWPEQQIGPMGGLLFYSWLQKEHPYAFDFRVTGDKWQTVSGWLRKHRLV